MMHNQLFTKYYIWIKFLLDKMNFTRFDLNVEWLRIEYKNFSSYFGPTYVIQ